MDYSWIKKSDFEREFCLKLLTLGAKFCIFVRETNDI